MEDNVQIDKFGQELEMRNIQERFISDYRKLASMMYYPPLCLSKNASRFKQDIVDAHEMIKSKRDYDQTLFGRIERRWAKQLKEARELSKDGSVSAEEAMSAYLKKNPNVEENQLPSWAVR